MASDDAPRPVKPTDESSSPSSRAQGKAKQSSPWSIRGVSREARAKATKAAARRRMTLGEWVTNALIEAANEDLGTGPRRAAAAEGPSGIPATAPTGEGVGEAMQMLAQRLAANEERDQALISLARRIDESETRESTLVEMSERMGGIESRTKALAALAGRLEAAEKREVAMLALMRGLAEQSQRSEDRLSGITKGLGDLALRLEESATRSGREFGAALAGSLSPLEGAIRELTSRLPDGGIPAAPQAAAQIPPQTPPAPAQAPAQDTMPPVTAPPVPAAPAPPAPAPTRLDTTNMAPEEAPPTEQQTKKKLAFSFENLNQAAIANTKGQVARGDGSAKKPARPAKIEPAKAEAAPKPAPKPAAQKPARKKKQQDDWAADHLAQADQAHEQLERLEPLAEERGDGNDAGTEAPPQLHGDVRPPKPRRKGLGLMGLLDGSDDD